jgi:hypothetical protein
MDETTKFTSHVSWAMAFCVRQTTFSCSDDCGDNMARSSIQGWHHTMFVLIPGFELKGWDGFMWKHLVLGSFQVETFRVYLLLWSKELNKTLCGHSLVSYCRAQGHRCSHQDSALKNIESSVQGNLQQHILSSQYSVNESTNSIANINYKDQSSPRDETLVSATLNTKHYLSRG